jgi:ribonuclease HI
MKFKIFTDGGAYKQKDNTFNSVASFRIYKEGELIDAGAEEELLEGKTNNYAEIYAIVKSLRKLLEYINAGDFKDIEIQIYTDSLLCVKSLNVWIKSWIKNAINGIFYNSNKQPVINQDLIKEAYKLILELKKFGNVYLWHINSHQSFTNVKELFKKFINFNKCSITIDDFCFALLKNKEVDESISKTYNKDK